MLKYLCHIQINFTSKYSFSKFSFYIIKLILLNKLFIKKLRVSELESLQTYLTIVFKNNFLFFKTKKLRKHI